MSFLTVIENDVKNLWHKEAPTIENALKVALKDVEGIWATAFGKELLTAAAQLSTATPTTLDATVESILATAKTNGISATKSSVTALIGLGASALESGAVSLSATTSTTTTT